MTVFPWHAVIAMLNIMCLCPCWWRMNKLRRLSRLCLSPPWSLDICYLCAVWLWGTSSIHSVSNIQTCRKWKWLSAICKYCFLLQSRRQSSLLSILIFGSFKAGPSGDHSSSVSAQPVNWQTKVGRCKSTVSSTAWGPQQKRFSVIHC